MASTLSGQPGSDEYRTLVERVVNRKPVREEPTLWQRFASSVSGILETVACAVGFTPLEERVLAEVLGRLRADALQKLDGEIDMVTVSAPFLPARFPENGMRKGLNNVFVRKGLAPPACMNEAQAVLAVTERLSCPPFEIGADIPFKKTNNPLNLVTTVYILSGKSSYPGVPSLGSTCCILLTTPSVLLATL
jgi:hypothetical protein